MFKRRSMIRGVTLVALVAFALLWRLPPEHLHRALDGRSQVHRHAIAVYQGDHSDHHEHGYAHDHGNTGEPDDHGNHDDAQVLKTVFESAHRFAPDSPVVAPATVVIAPCWRVGGHIALLYEWICHDPPERPTSLRAPPA